MGISFDFPEITVLGSIDISLKVDYKCHSWLGNHFTHFADSMWQIELLDVFPEKNIDLLLETPERMSNRFSFKSFMINICHIAL